MTVLGVVVLIVGLIVMVVLMLNPKLESLFNFVVLLLGFIVVAGLILVGEMEGSPVFWVLFVLFFFKLICDLLWLRPQAKCVKEISYADQYAERLKRESQGGFEELSAGPKED